MLTFNKLIFVLLATAAFTGCSQPLVEQRPPTPVINTRTSTLEKFSLATVQSNIKKGITNKAEVFLLLGTPNLITKTRNGNELHVYDKRSVETETASGAGANVTVRNERTITIAITYSPSDLVEEVSYRASSF